MSEAHAVRVRGMLRGAELASEAQLVVEARRLALVHGEATTSIALASLGGLAVHDTRDGTSVTLFVGDGDVVELDDAPVSALLGAVFALPELTRALRAFGSARALPGADHDRFFAPLLEPLRRARTAHERALVGDGAPWRVASLFDAADIAASLRTAISAFASARCAVAGPDRRALEAELLDESEELFDALGALGAAAQALAQAADETRATTWRAWSAALARVFVAADRAWVGSVPALRAG